MTINPQFAGWPMVSESAEAADKQKYANELYALQAENADFWAAAWELRNTLGYTPFTPPEEINWVQAASLNPQDIGGVVDISASEDSDILRDGETHDDVGIEGDEIIDIERLDEQVYSPFINRLVEDRVIPSQVWTEIKINLQEWWDFRWVIKSSDIDSEAQQLIIDRWGELNSEEYANNFQDNFQKDFWNELWEFQNEKWEFTSERMSEAYDMVSTRYMIAEWNNTQENKTAALNMAFEMWINAEIQGKIFTRSLDFENNFKNVKDRTKSISERFQSFMKVLEVVDTDQGAKGGKVKQRWELSRQQAALRTAGLEQQYTEQQAALQAANIAADIQAQQRAQMALQETLEKAAEITWWDLGSWDTAFEVWNVEVWEIDQKTA